MYLNDIFTIPANLAGVPAISVPCGLDGAGPPGRPAVHGPRARRGHAVPRRARARGTTSRSTCGRPSWPEAARRGPPSADGKLTPQWPTTRPSSGSSATSSSPRARRCSAGAGSGSATSPTRTCARCASGIPGRCPSRTSARSSTSMRIGLALDSQIAPHSVFARKNYFYPDMPKNYQISQYDLPIVRRRASRRRAARRHREARRHHARAHGGGHRQDDASPGRPGGSPRPTTRSSTSTAPASRSWRCVSEPDMRSPEEAAAYLRDAPGDPRVARRERRPDGGGVPPVRRQRLSASGRRPSRSARRSRSRT